MTTPQERLPVYAMSLQAIEEELDELIGKYDRTRRLTEQEQRRARALARERDAIKRHSGS